MMINVCKNTQSFSVVQLQRKDWLLKRAFLKLIVNHNPYEKASCLVQLLAFNLRIGAPFNTFHKGLLSCWSAVFFKSKGVVSFQGPYPVSLEGLKQIEWAQKLKASVPCTIWGLVLPSGPPQSPRLSLSLRLRFNVAFAKLECVRHSSRVLHGPPCKDLCFFINGFVDV